jgi:hypothetical protein
MKYRLILSLFLSIILINTIASQTCITIDPNPDEIDNVPEIDYTTSGVANNDFILNMISPVVNNRSEITYAFSNNPNDINCNGTLTRVEECSGAESDRIKYVADYTGNWDTLVSTCLLDVVQEGDYFDIIGTVIISYDEDITIIRESGNFTETRSVVAEDTFIIRFGRKVTGSYDFQGFDQLNEDVYVNLFNGVGAIKVAHVTTYVQKPFILSFNGYVEYNNLFPVVNISEIVEERDCELEGSGYVLLCKQVWQIFIDPDDNECQFDNILYDIQFISDCHVDYTDDCPITTDTQDSTLSITLSTNDYCGAISGDIILLSMDLTSHPEISSVIQWGSISSAFFENEKISIKGNVAVPDGTEIVSVEPFYIEVTTSDPNLPSSVVLIDVPSSIVHPDITLTIHESANCECEANEFGFSFDMLTSIWNIEADTNSAFSIVVQAEVTYNDGTKKRKRAILEANQAGIYGEAQGSLFGIENNDSTSGSSKSTMNYSSLLSFLLVSLFVLSFV